MSHLMPPYKGYDPEQDSTIANVFATAAFRFAHVTVQPVVSRLGPGYATNPQHPPLPLHHSLFASWRVVQEGKERCCQALHFDDSDLLMLSVFFWGVRWYRPSAAGSVAVSGQAADSRSDDGGGAERKAVSGTGRDASGPRGPKPPEGPGSRPARY